MPHTATKLIITGFVVIIIIAKVSFSTQTSIEPETGQGEGHAVGEL